MKWGNDSFLVFLFFIVAFDERQHVFFPLPFRLSLDFLLPVARVDLHATVISLLSPRPAFCLLRFIVLVPFALIDTTPRRT